MNALWSYPTGVFLPLESAPGFERTGAEGIPNKCLPGTPKTALAGAKLGSSINATQEPPS